MSFHSNRIFLTAMFCCVLSIIQVKAQQIHVQQTDRKITYHGKASLEKILSNIVKQAGYSYIYLEDDVVLNNNVTLHVDSIALDTVLLTLFQNFSLTYTIKGTVINIKRKIAAPGNAAGQADAFVSVEGEVITESGESIEGATVSVEGTAKRVLTDKNGQFKLSVRKGSVLVISNVSMETRRIQVNSENQQVNIRLRSNYSWIGRFNVIGKVNNGYIKVHKLKAIGAFDLIDRQLLERNTSPFITDRIENLSPGLLINHGGQAPDGSAVSSLMLVRGLSTIYANAGPLQVVDNFPYDGDISNINPNDIENITILKDAAATAIWGARAGNGVIVITTKKGNTAVPRMNYQTTFTFQQRPDIFNMRTISSKDFIEREEDLFSKGYYDGLSNGSNSGFLSGTPVVNLLQAVREGLITQNEANSRIDLLKKQDVRNDIGKYLYRNSISQQHSLQISGSSSAVNYFFSLNWDHDPSNLSAAAYNRISLRSQNSFKLTDHLQFDAGINLTEGITQRGSNPGYQLQGLRSGRSLYPYARLADDQGNPLPVSMDLSDDYIQQTAKLGFLNWQYVPLKDISTGNNRIKTKDLLFNMGAQYTLSPFFNIEMKYQFENQLISGRNVYSDSSYFARDLVNSFTQVDPVSNTLSYPVPLGGILDQRNRELVSHQGRIQLNYHKIWESHNELTALGGFEIKSLVTKENANRYYGYNGDISTVNGSVDLSGTYMQYQLGNPMTIPGIQDIHLYTDHFLSRYASANYLHRRRYGVFVSARNDEANLFGTRTNGKGIPLWSTGFSWQVDNENFYRIKWLPFLKLRASYGSSGNLSRLSSSYTTATYKEGGITGTPFTVATIQSPPNKNLRWEQVRMLNAGIEFSTKKNTLSGAVEYYHKEATDLMAQTSADPTLGLTITSGAPSYYYANSAALTGNGVDFQLESHNLTGGFKWTTNLIFSHTTSRVTKYLLSDTMTGINYLHQNTINPVRGRPVYAIYSYKWMGLNPATGDPQGVINGKASEEWTSLYNKTLLDSLVYSGPSQPVTYGSLRNTFTLGRFSASCNISYKFGYYFRKPSISYSDLFYTWNGSADYAQRWQKPGDEKKNNVPSLPSQFDPSNSDRDNFYLYSSALVKRADNIRLEDISLSYELDKQKVSKLPFQRLRFFAYLSNLGLLWKANKDGIDPYYINVPKDGKRISLGMNVQF